MTHSKIIFKIKVNFKGIAHHDVSLNMNRRSSHKLYEPKTLSETMNDQQSYYETMYILRPDIAEDEVANHIDKYNKLLEEFGGTILDSQMRGKRRLAYQIAKHREGVYVQLSHQGDGQHIFKIEKAMRLSEDVIRYMTVKQEGPLPTPKPSNNSTPQLEENKENPETKVEPKASQAVTTPEASTSGKDNTENNANE